jgi:type I restriction enzyme S subunit
MSSKTQTSATKEEDKPALVPKLRFPEFREGGAWTTETLGSVAKISTAKVGDKTCIPMSITSGIGLVSQMEKFGRIIAGSSYANYLQLKKNDFAYNKSATKEYPEGFIALYTGDKLAAVPNSIFTCFRVTGDSPVPQYLNYLLLGNLHGRWLRKFIEVGARAHGSLSINEDDLLALPVPLPSGKTSVQEQQKIAECLSSVDELLAAQARKVDALKTHKKGLMQQLFPREGETQPRLRFPEFQNAGEWEDDQLGSVCELYQPVTLSSSELTMTGEHLVYGANGVIGTHNKSNHEDSEIAVTCRGATCGEVTTTKPKSWITGNAMVVKPRNKKLRKDFIFHYFKNHGLKNVISGSAQPQITRTGFAPLIIFFPEPAEQQRIASCLSSLDALITAETQKHEALKTHKKGLMQQLFPSPEEVEA